MNGHLALGRVGRSAMIGQICIIEGIPLIVQYEVRDI